MARHDLDQGMDIFKTMKILEMIDNFGKEAIKISVMGLLAQRYQLIQTIIEEGIAKGQFEDENSYFLTMMYSGILNNAMMAKHTFGTVEMEKEDLIDFIMKKLN
jgi:hypothetical protein